MWFCVGGFITLRISHPDGSFSAVLTTSCCSAESMMEVRSYNSLRVDPASPMPVTYTSMCLSLPLRLCPKRHRSRSCGCPLLSTIAIIRSLCNSIIRYRALFYARADRFCLVVQTPMHNDSDYYGESGHHMMKPHDPMLSSAHGHDEDHYTGFNSVEMARAVPLPAQPLNYFNNGTGPLPGGAVRAIPVSSPPVSPAHRNGAPLMATATVIPAHAVAAAVPAVAVARPFPASSPTSSNGGSFKAKQTTPRSPHFSAGGNPNGATPAFAKPGQDLWDTGACSCTNLILWICRVSLLILTVTSYCFAGIAQSQAQSCLV
jgi:hypothetical protein